MEMGQKKCFGHFFTKISMQRFLPLRSPAVPSEGRLCPTPPGPPPPGGPPRKRGRPSRAEFRAKKCKKGAKIGGKWGFWGQKCAKMCTFCTFLTKSQKRAGSYAGEKTLHSHPCPLCKNPPIYTVLNAAFSAPPPPLGGTSAQSAPPEGSRGPAPQNPAQAEPPFPLPERL